MVKLAPSNNSEKESKQFGILALICGILSLLLWFIAIAAIGFGIRGVILSRRVKSTKYLVFSIVGVVLGIIAIIYYYMAR